LSAVGLALGLPVGALLSRLLVEAFATDIYQLPFHIDTVTFVNTVVLTVVFVLMANVVAHRRVRRLDMIEVLKSRE
jgi:putative ABC transport system permease protein